MYIQTITVLVSLFCYKKFKTSYYKYFIWLLVYILANEVVALFYGSYIDYGVNQIFYNLYNVINFSFLFWLFYKLSWDNFFKIFVKIVALLYVSSLILEIFYLKVNYYQKPQIIPFIIGGVGILFCVLVFFFQILNSNKIIFIHKKLIFWICSGYFIYYLSYLPLKVKQNYFAEIDGYHYLFNILIVGTFIKNILLIIGFIWSTEKEKY